MKWLHISDLHYQPQKANFDTKQLLSNLNTYIINNGITVDAIFCTGDFRFAKSQEATLENAKIAADKLKEIAENAGVNVKDIHIVPGNHDLERGDSALLERVYELYKDGEFASLIEHNGKQLRSIDYLWSRFSFFELVAKELSNKTWLDVPTGNYPCYHRVGKIGNEYNILYLNTALGCGRKNERGSLYAGYEHIYQLTAALDSQLPTIALGHHGLNCFTRLERERIKSIFLEKNIKLYLCGDEHVGGFDDFGDTLQLTAGCLTSAQGVEPTFYIGTIDENHPPVIEAFTYLSGANTGWTISQLMGKKIDKWISKMYPSATRSIFGRDKLIKDITNFMKSPGRKIAEVWGVAGVGKTTICNEILKSLGSAVSVDTRLYNTTIEIQREILMRLGIDVDQRNINPDDYADILQNAAKQARKTLYLDNTEVPIEKDETAFSALLLKFVRESNWHVLYSTQKQLNANNIKPFYVGPLLDDDAYSMFVSRRWETKDGNELSNEEKQLAREISVTLLSRHPLAIVIATSPRQNKRSLAEIRKDLQNKVSFEFDDPYDPHRSMSAALSLAVSGINKSPVSAQAREVWLILAQYPGIFSDEFFSHVFGENAEYNDARFALRDFSLIDGYVMLEPVKAEAYNFSHEEIKASRDKLFRVLSILFAKGNDFHSPDRQKWHDLSLTCLQSLLHLLVESKHNNFEMVRLCIFSAYNYFQFSSYTSLEALYKLEPLFCDKGDMLGLANVLLSMGDLERRLGQISSAQKHYADAEQLYRDEQIMLGLANVLQSMGDLELRFGQTDTAKKHYADTEQLYRDEQDMLGLANVLKSMGDLELRLGQINSAQNHYADAEQLYRDEQDMLGLANLLTSMGDLERHLGQTDNAILKYLIALELYEREQEPMGRAYCLAELCLTYAMQKDEKNFQIYGKAANDTLESVSENVAEYIVAHIREAEDTIGLSLD